MARLDGEVCSDCLHFPQLLPGDLHLFHSLPCHPLPLPCLGNSFCCPCCFLLLLCLLNRKPSLGQSGLVPEWCAGPETKTTPPLLHLAHDVPVLECCLCLLCCFCLLHFLSVVRMGAAWATSGSLESISIISSRTLVHLYSSDRLEMGSSRTPLPYSPIATAEASGKTGLLFAYKFTRLLSVLTHQSVDFFEGIPPAC